MAKEWKDFRQLIKLHVTNCPNTVLDEITKRTIIDFCEGTKIYILEADGITLTEDTANYTPVFTAEAVTPIRIKYAYHGDNQLIEISEYTLNHAVVDWRNEDATDPTHIFLNADGDVQVYPYPNADSSDTLTVNFIVKPTMSATDVPDFFYDDYGMEIAEGVAYQLKRMPGKPWTSPSESALHYRFYKAGIARARKAVMKSRGMGPSTVNPRSFGGVSLWNGETAWYNSFE